MMAARAFHHAFFYLYQRAVTVTGLTTVSTAEQWSTFGRRQLFLWLVRSVVWYSNHYLPAGVAIGRKMGLRTKLIAQEVLNISRLGEVGGIIKSVSLCFILHRQSLRLCFDSSVS